MAVEEALVVVEETLPDEEGTDSVHDPQVGAVGVVAVAAVVGTATKEDLDRTMDGLVAVLLAAAPVWVVHT